MSLLRDWPLRRFLLLLLVATVTAVLAIVAGVLLGRRLPQIADDCAQAVRQQADELAARIALRQAALALQMQALGYTLPDLAPDQLPAALAETRALGQDVRALYLVSTQNRVHAMALPPDLLARQKDLAGLDLSGHRLVQAARLQPSVVWSPDSVSLLDGVADAGFALRLDGGRVLLVELQRGRLAQTVHDATLRPEVEIWLLDRTGELVTSSPGARKGATNLFDLPLLQAALQGKAAPDHMQLAGGSFHAAVAAVPNLGWYIVAGTPAGLQNEQVRASILLVLLVVAGTFGLGLLVAPPVASWMGRTLEGIVQRAGRIAQGADQADQPWPRGLIAEFNHLRSGLDRVAATLREHERDVQAIFHASPVPMAVSEPGAQGRVLDVNHAWSTEFGVPREGVLGRPWAQAGGWRRAADGERLLQDIGTEPVSGEAQLLRADGRPMLARVFVRKSDIGAGQRLIWTCVDITQQRSMELELRALNQELESRVALRTQALAQANTELSAVVANLQLAQDDLVRSARMAALGSLVAGVAHELNTPLGNGLLAATSLAERARTFRARLDEAPAQQDVDRFAAGMVQGADIAARNLQRAAELVRGFKLVSVDRTSAQRRSFELRTVVDAMVLSLQPSFSHTAQRVVVDIAPQGLLLDSFPGALGQVVDNLVQNALRHAFEGRGDSPGTVRITGSRDARGDVLLEVADDGNGIAPTLLPHVFEPFVTSRMGSGGTGLGLHIVWNAVVNLLGGSISVHSTPGQGSRFSVRLPAVAPGVDAAGTNGPGGA